jgi:N-acetylglucosamine-6-phosphate deacetylase
MTHQPFIIKNATVYGENKKYVKGYMKVENEKVVEVGDMKDLSKESIDQYQVISSSSSQSVIPGMIDVHIHGVAGADTMDATHNSLEKMTSTLPKEGTTSFLATTITQSISAIEMALENAAEFISKPGAIGHAEVLGIHLEGPFISSQRAGAQPVEHIIKPNLELFKKWQNIAKENIKLVTLAPEEENGYELVKYLREKNIVASIGHSDATADEVHEAVRVGATHVTHLFNGMRGIHHREPGTVGAALSNDNLFVEIIADGIHIHPETINLSYRLKTSNKVILITDSIRAKGLSQGTYDLGGRDVTVTDSKAYLSDGTLAGSILPMKSAFKNFMGFTQCSLEDIITMTAINPAKQLNVFDRKGSLQSGKDADFVLLDENYDVLMTFCKGHLAYTKK